MITQPAHGAVGVSSNVATYFPEAGFVGTDTFTYAAWNGSKNSLLATGTVAVAQGPFSLVAKALVPPSYPAGWVVPFAAVATPVNVAVAPAYRWSFGDGSVEVTNQYPTHAYANPGSYNWNVLASVQSGVSVVTTNISGIITISAPVALAVVPAGADLSLIWPQTLADVLVEKSTTLGPEAHWSVVTNEVVTGGGNLQVVIPSVGQGFFRLRKL